MWRSPATGSSRSPSSSPGEYDRYQEVAERHGFEISPKRLRQVVEHFDDPEEDVSAWRKILEGTTSALLRQSGSAG